MKSFIRTAGFLGALALPLTVASTAGAEPLGVPGQIAIAGDFGFELSRSSTNADNDQSVTRFTLAPAADYFIAPNLSVGGQLLFSQTSAGDNDVRQYQILARAGYVIGLGKLSIWPKAGLGFNHNTLGDASNNFITLNLFAPVQFHPADHFFIGIGPFFNLDLVATDNIDDSDPPKQTDLGLLSTVGGYF